MRPKSNAAARVMGLDDKPMWESIRAGAMKLQRCKHCATWLTCPVRPVRNALPNSNGRLFRAKGRSSPGRRSTVTICRPIRRPTTRSRCGSRRAYDDENLEGAMPEDGCIGRAMRLIDVTMPDGVMLPRWRDQKA